MSVPVSQKEITAEWFQTILHEARENVTVNNVKVEPGTKAGENFSAEVVRASVTGSKDGEAWSKSYMIKIMPAEQWLKDILMQMKIFDQEVEAYERILPDMVSVQEGDNKILSDTPRCLFAKMDGGSGIIVMDDLKPQGYKLGDVRKGLDVHHCRLVMQNLARFHALGYKCKYNAEESLIRKYPNLANFPYSCEQQIYIQLRDNGIKYTKLILSEAAGMEEQLKIFEEKGKEAVMKGHLNNTSEPLSTICHGDSWCNNMLFKYGENDQPVSQKLLDLQLMHYGLPTRDLGYFFCLSTNGELRRNHLNGLLQYYHRQLLHCLSLLGVTQITEKEFPFETLWELYYKETIHSGLMQSLSCLPFLLLNPEDLRKPSEMEGNSMEENMKLYEKEMIEKVLSNENILTRVSDIINEMIPEGVFD